MHGNQVQHGYLYAVSADRDFPFSVEPYLCVETELGKRFIFSKILNLDVNIDGPHHVTPEVTAFAARHGWKLHPDDLWGYWSEREKAESVLACLNPVQLSDTAEHPIVLEAERILTEMATPQGQASTWLRNSEHWRGSSMNALYDENGRLAGAFISVYTDNPYKLRSILRWLGVPKQIVQRITGLER